MYDVLVCGAGPAGATVAALLANAGMKVTVVDPLARPIDRLELVAPSTTRLFDAIGLGHLLHDDRLSRYCSGIRRDWGGDVSVDEFLAQRAGNGYVVDRSRLDGALREFSQDAGAHLRGGKVVAIECDRSTFLARLRQDGFEETLHASFVVDASGRVAALARRLGTLRVLHEALLARRTDEPPVDTKGRLLVEGRSGSWTYRLEGPGGRYEAWEVSSKQGSAGSKGTVVDASSILSFPSAGSGWVAIGDAAASFDPICSQGIANAISTALTIAGAIASNAGFGKPAAQAYSEAVRHTFANAERGRRLSYAQLTARHFRASSR
jgi:flavin-dependent dehydrogenase